MSDKFSQIPIHPTPRPATKPSKYTQLSTEARSNAARTLARHSDKLVRCLDNPEAGPSCQKLLNGIHSWAAPTGETPATKAADLLKP